VASRTCAKTDSVCFLKSVIISSFDFAPITPESGAANDAEEPGGGASSRAFRSAGAGLDSARESWVGPSTTSSKREVFAPGCGIDEDGSDLNCGGVNVDVTDGADVDLAVGVGVTTGVGDEVGDGLGVEVGVDVDLGVDVGVTTGVGDGVGLNVDVAVAIGVGTGDAVGVGVGCGVEDRIGDRTGIGVGKSSVSSVRGVSTGFGDSSFGGGVAVGVGVRPSSDPGSDQSPTFSPFANFACSRVCPCSLITSPSNFPSTILPV
jgi:hypothetical protein